jgi:hypothetical protein
MTPSLDHVRELGALESGLAVAITYRPNASAHATVVNAGVLEHPVTGEPVVGFVVRGHARKLEHLRTRPAATVVFRSGWEWVAVEGPVEVVGPADVLPGVAARDVPRRLRAVYAAALGGTADDWAELDETMANEGHTAALVQPARLYTNPAEPRAD